MRRRVSLATASADGLPLVVPICFALVEGRIYSAVDAKPKRTRDLRRLRNVADNPHVSLVIDLWDEDWTKLALGSLRRMDEAHGGMLAPRT